ncbi:MAG: hypothetical protein RIQ64_238 [Actinomycetota bacterium]|jgi:hypothetical protein
MARDNERWDRLRTALNERLGIEVTDDLLAQFPPDGWGDVARSQDLVSVNARIDQVEARMTSIETRMTSIEAKVDQIEAHLTSLGARMGSLENEIRVKFTSMENHIGVLDGRMKLMVTGGIALIGIVLAIQVQTLFVMTGL